MIYLSEEEVYGWSGYKQPARQIRWLKKYGIRFTVAANGHPRVLKSDVGISEKQPPRKPNFEALRALR